MSASLPPYTEEVTSEDIAAVEKVLQHIDHQNFKRAVLTPLANWLLALKIYKELEVRYTCMQDRSRLVQGHRALLTAIMAAGECMLAVSESFTDDDLKAIGVTKAAIAANVNYLRTKYAQWYSKRDEARVRETLLAIDKCEQGKSGTKS